MGSENREKSPAPVEREEESRRERSRDRDRERSHRHHRSSHHHHHHHEGRDRDRHHRSSGKDKGESKGDRDRDRGRDRDRDRDRGRGSDRHHRKKRSRHESSHNDDRRRRRKSRKEDDEGGKAAPASAVKSDDEDAGEWVEAKAPVIPTDTTEAPQPTNPEPALKRDTWMTEPSADFIDYTQRGTRKATPPRTLAKPDYRPIIHKNELNQQLVAGKSLDEYAADTNDEPSYTFGDSGSKWRMTKLKRVYEAAAEGGKPLEEVAIERYGDLKTFDEAREEEMELGRTDMYGTDRRDAKTRPTGELYAERLKKMADEDMKRREREGRYQADYGLPKLAVLETVAPPAKVLDQTALNRMKAAYMKAQIRGDPKAMEMEQEYNDAVAAAAEARSNLSTNQSQQVVITAMDSRHIAGLEGRMGREVVSGKKGKVLANDEMTLDDMVREEKRTRGAVAGGEGMLLAERIARDAKFDDNLDYLDENATKLAKHVQRSELDLKNMAISEFKRMQQVLNTCPLCEQDDKPPIAPVVATGTRVFLTLPTEPELSAGGAVIVPIQHRVNMMECDDDEWEEVRNFMKSLTRMYSSQNRSVIFYENAASPHRKRHAAITAVPLPLELGETAAAYFKEAIMSADEEWSQHKKLIDTLSRARKEGLGKQAFRRSFVKQMPYFHVWLEIDGGLGHIIEDENRWPKGDLFAREVLGGMLDVGMEVVKRQGRWRRGGEGARVKVFREAWEKWDWTKVLYDV